MFAVNIGSNMIVGQYAMGVIDGPDDDKEPNLIPLVGTITFTPSITNLVAGTAGAAGRSVGVALATIKGVLDEEGYLCTPYPDGVRPMYRGVSLFATDSLASSNKNWTWSVVYRFNLVNGVTPVIESHSLSVPAKTGPLEDDINLPDFAPVPSSPGIGTPQALALLARAEAAADIALKVKADADAGLFKGAKGDPGPNTVPTNQAVADAIAAPGPAATVLSATIGAQVDDAMAGIDINVDKYRIGAEAAVAMGIAPRKPMDTPPLRFFGKASGVGAATVASGGTGYVVGDEITLAGGAFWAPAVLRVNTVNAGGVTSVTVITVGVYTTNPASPVGQASTTGAGTGATFTLTFGSGSATRNRTHYHPGNFPQYFRFSGNGPKNINSSGFWGNDSGGGTASLWEWESDAPRIEIRLGGLNTKAILYVDGQRLEISELGTDATGGGYLYALNFDGSPRIRSFRLFMVNSSFGGVNLSSGDVIRAPQQEKPFAWGLGDSYMFGSGAANVSMASFNIMCEQLGIDGLPDGVGGGGWVTSTAGTPQVRVTNKFLTLTRTPAYVFLDMGYNDRNQNAATIATNFNATVSAIQSKTPTAKIIVFGPATPQGITPALTAVRDTLAARCAALSLPFIDQMGWLNMDNEALYVGTDNEHPTQLGHSYLGVLKAEHVRRYL